jgi:hypothetical protein
MSHIAYMVAVFFGIIILMLLYFNQYDHLWIEILKNIVARIKKYIRGSND